MRLGDGSGNNFEDRTGQSGGGMSFGGMGGGLLGMLLPMVLSKFGIVGLLALFFIWKFVPESRGRTLEQVEEGVTTGNIFTVDKHGRRA